MKRRVVVTGLGVVSSIGIGWGGGWGGGGGGGGGYKRIGKCVDED